ncbi:MAG: TIM barrel protein [Bythopirellula sp.]
MATIRIGNAPCSWGALEFDDLEGDAIGCHQMLDELAESGYAGTELGDWGFLPTDPERLHVELTKRKLELLGAFVPVRLIDPAQHQAGRKEVLGIARHLARMNELGRYQVPPYLVLADDNGSDPLRRKHAGRVTEDMNMTAAQWGAFARGAEEIARAVKEQTGLSTVFHHHCAGYIESPSEIAKLLDRTDPQALGLVFDTGHFTYGSGKNDPATQFEFLDRYADRIWYVHFKDCQPDIADAARRGGWDYFRAVREGVFCELGQGCVDFQGMVNWLRQRDYDHWIVVEQDILPGMGTPKESAQRNREYLRSIGT